MKHIIDADELDKLIRVDYVYGYEREVIDVKELRALLANSPQADDVRKDADTIALETAGTIMGIVINSFNKPPSQIKAKVQIAIRNAIDKARE